MSDRLLIDGAADGAWQMAVDEALLASAADGSGCSLRFYQWSEPTLTLGYFQRQVDRASHQASRDCPLVRRQTGGGAIVHDRELTYSLAIAAAHPLAGAPQSLYDAAHDALVRALAGFGITLERWKSAGDRSGSEPFLCFQRRSPGDLLCGGFKVCGSAQRRRRGAILQHGSLLLASSERAPELPGLWELCGKLPATEDLIAAWSEQLAGGLRLKWGAARLFPEEIAAATALCSEKYTADWWNGRR